ncbi:unnamed protein product [Clonostachys rhizophaga]|uniref:Xylanolytic transcriptional activator regulatory domain-containing protein n=1 Tax=Clonostachys rhizophaga TaxID=160324 RepID=A0A9N9YTF9_9HYPO|nr:unnamed protein product [Clonostachys rhizophaga]
MSPNTQLVQSTRSCSYKTLGDGDNEPRTICVQYGEKDISQSDSTLVEFLSQDFDQGSVGDYQATFIDDYANNVRLLGPTFGKGFRPNVHHFRDAPFIKRSNGSIPRMITEDERTMLDHSGAFILPDAEIANGFIRAFFDRVHPTIPIIDQANFRQSYLRPFSADGNGPPLLLIQAVLLSGSTVWQHPRLKLPAEEISKRLFARAHALVYHRFEQDRFTLIIAHLLFSTYTCDSCDDTVQNMWLSLGIAVRIAQGLGLHRDLGAARADRQHRLQWKKTWWTLFLHDTLCAFEWGRPRAIHLADTDVDEICEADFDPPELGALPCREHVDFFISAIHLCYIISDWLDDLRPGGPQTHRRIRRREDGIHQARAELQKWYDGLPPTMTASSRGSSSHYSLWSGMLNITYCAAVVRFYSVAPVDPRKVHESAVAISTICTSLFNQGLLSSVWVYAIHQLYLSMCHHAIESKSPDQSVAAQGLENLCTSLPMLEQLSRKNSVARQAFRFLDNVAKRSGSDAPADDPWQEDSNASLWAWEMDVCGKSLEPGKIATGSQYFLNSIMIIKCFKDLEIALVIAPSTL